MNKVGIANVYIGELPASFPDFVSSARSNSDIDFHFFGDCFDQYVSQGNLFFHDMSFAELKDLVIKNVGCRPFDKIYKVCDFKVAYFALFHEYLKSYDIWGLFDLDVVIGDLGTFFQPSNLDDNWARFFDLGHLSFIKNQPAINYAFRANTSVDYWGFISQSKFNWIYDERYYYGLGGFNGKLLDLGYKIVHGRGFITDIYPQFLEFFDREKGMISLVLRKSVENKLFRMFFKDGILHEEETAYAHFQKRSYRKMVFDSGSEYFYPSHWSDVDSYESLIYELKENVITPCSFKDTNKTYFKFFEFLSGPRAWKAFLRLVLSTMVFRDKKDKFYIE